MARSRPLNQRAAAPDSTALIRWKRSFRSRSARVVTSTRYAMPVAHFFKHFAGGPRPSMRDIVQALSNCFEDVSARGYVEKPLVSFRVLNYGLGLSVDRQN